MQQSCKSTDIAGCRQSKRIKGDYPENLMHDTQPNQPEHWRNRASLETEGEVDHGAPPFRFKPHRWAQLCVSNRHMLVLRQSAVSERSIDLHTSQPIVGASLGGPAINKIGRPVIPRFRIKRLSALNPIIDAAACEARHRRHILLRGLTVLPIQAFGHVRSVKGALQESIGGRTFGMIDCPARKRDARSVTRPRDPLRWAQSMISIRKI